jgi:hypothetical protein
MGQHDEVGRVRLEVREHRGLAERCDLGRQEEDEPS